MIWWLHMFLLQRSWGQVFPVALITREIRAFFIQMSCGAEWEKLFWLLRVWKEISLCRINLKKKSSLYFQELRKVYYCCWTCLNFQFFLFRLNTNLHMDGTRLGLIKEKIFECLWLSNGVLLTFPLLLLSDSNQQPHGYGGGQQRSQHSRPFFYVQPPSQPYYVYQHWQLNHPYSHYGLPGGSALFTHSCASMKDQSVQTHDYMSFLCQYLSLLY